MIQYLTKEERAVNQWDNRFSIARDRSALPLPHVKAVVTHVWDMVQLKRPPAVVQLTPDDALYVAGASAWVSHDCLTVAIQAPQVSTAVVLHEMAHAILEDPLDALELRSPAERAMHGPLWLANYLWLMGRLMGPLYNPFHMRGTLPPQVSQWTIPWHPTVHGKARADLV